jgi:hypothetical protein
MTQNQLVYDYLVTVGPLRPMAALNELGIYRLASRINDLRKAGHKIKTKKVEVVNRWANHHTLLSIAWNLKMLPNRIAKKPKRTARWRSQGHLNFIRSFHCARDGCQGMPIECAHVRNGSGAGMGQKPDDWRVVPLCREHHSEQHTVGEQTFWKGVDIEALIEAFCKASPKAREIKEAQDK